MTQTEEQTTRTPHEDPSRDAGTEPARQFLALGATPRSNPYYKYVPTRYDLDIGSTALGHKARGKHGSTLRQRKEPLPPFSHQALQANQTPLVLANANEHTATCEC